MSLELAVDQVVAVVEEVIMQVEQEILPQLHLYQLKDLLVEMQKAQELIQI